MASPLNKIERAHQMYRDGCYQEALGFYTEALSMAKTNPQRIALHSNRAACYLKLHDFRKAAEECTSVLELDRDHTGALMLRAQTLVTLKEYHSALFDVNRLMELNSSSEVYRNLEARLRTQLSLAPIPESEAEAEEEEEDINAKDCRRNDANVLPKHETGGIAAATFPNLENIERNDISSSTSSGAEGIALEAESDHKSSEQGLDKEVWPASIPPTPEVTVPLAQGKKVSSNGWQAIPKPKGHSALDYARWDSVEDNSSEDESNDEDEEESVPQYRFRVRTVGVRPVK
ncbi:protein unc-45 homolog A [Punica granatum]|uniref:Protein unc-45 homolog A n=1 Tax=Punica granatum TaxID=22663 RepID=A0A6P8DWD9_PUNGR|nr:protein unc-45 homolog A [Punica granatum]XP_031397519.1 protein unc-45 homolog A [Punica granatum]XP_031397521.1 protein unc-45 homolog A [Punica granatum]